MSTGTSTDTSTAEPTLQDLIDEEQKTLADKSSDDDAAPLEGGEPSEKTTTEPEDEDTGEPSEGEPTESLAAFRDAVAEATGWDMSRYADDEAAAAGLKELGRWASQKNEDASAGRMIRELGVEEAFARFKGQSKSAEDKSTPAESKSNLPSSYSEYQALLDQARIEQAKPVTERDESLFRRGLEAERTLQRRSLEIAQNELPALQQRIAGLEKKLAEQEQEWTSSSEQYERESWFSDHAGDIWQDRKANQLTALGHRMVALQRDGGQGLIERHDPGSLARWEAAYWVAKAEMPAQKKAPQPGRSAGRQPSTARKPPKVLGADDLRKQGITDEGEILRRLAQQTGEL